MQAFLFTMKTTQRWCTSRVYVIVVFAILMLFEVMTSFCDVTWRHDVILWRHTKSWHHLDIDQLDDHTKFRVGISNGSAVSVQTNRRTERNRGPILLPRPLTRVVKNTFLTLCVICGFYSVWILISVNLHSKSALFYFIPGFSEC